MNILLSIGIICLAITILHEYSWMKRKKWLRTKGEVLGFEERKKNNSTTFFPIILCGFLGREIKFTSEYGSSHKPKIGSETIVIISPDDSEIEQYSFSNRWMLTLIPLFMALLLIIKVGHLSK